MNYYPESIWAQQEEQTPLSQLMYLQNGHSKPYYTAPMCHLSDDKDEDSGGRRRASPSLPSGAEKMFVVAGIGKILIPYPELLCPLYLLICYLYDV